MQSFYTMKNIILNVAFFCLIFQTHFLSQYLLKDSLKTLKFSLGNEKVGDKPLQIKY